MERSVLFPISIAIWRNAYDRKISERQRSILMFGHVRRTEAPVAEALPAQNDGYVIWQDERRCETAQTYDEAARKGKAAKRRYPKAKVEIQYSGVMVELK